MTALPLHSPDGQILKFLGQIVSIGRHRKAWHGRDVVRVAYDHLPHPHTLDRALAAERARADKAEAALRQARARIRELENAPTALVLSSDDLPPRRVIEVSRSQYEAFALYCEGEPRSAIAAELGLAPGTIGNYVATVAARIETDAARAAAMVNRGVVSIRPRTAAKQRRSAA